MFGRFKLRDADEMFAYFFDRWYDEESRRMKGVPATRPDMVEVPEFVGKSVGEVCPVSEATTSDVLTQVEAMCEAASADWPSYLPVTQPIRLNWVEAFDKHFDFKRVQDLARRSDQSDFTNEYLVTVCEFGAVLGFVMKQELPRLAWLASWPYWETAIFDSRTGHVIPVFHWAMKKFSTYGINDGFAAKIKACIGVLETGTRALP